LRDLRKSRHRKFLSSAQPEPAINTVTLRAFLSADSLQRSAFASTSMFIKAARNLLFGAAVALQNELIELVGLLRDAIGSPLFLLAPGCSGRLLDKLSKIVSQDRDAIVEFRH
jgi:hypothetical protein